MTRRIFCAEATAGLRRRSFAGLAWCLLVLGSASVPAPAGGTEPADPAKVEKAYTFAYAIGRMVETERAAVARAERLGRPPLNHLGHRRELTDHRHRFVTTPNHDTLYSAAWLDLTNGPVRLSVPASPDRYVSAALLDMTTDNVAVLYAGEEPKTVWIARHGEDVRPADDEALVISPTVDAWLILRIYVDGPGDLETARQVQSAFDLVPPAGAPPVFAFPGDGSPLDAPSRLVDMVNLVMARSPERFREARAVFAGVGLDGRESGAWAALAPDLKIAWTDAARTVRPKIERDLDRLGRFDDGWFHPIEGLGRFGEDYEGKATLAAIGLGALPLKDATYLTTEVDGAGAPLDGASNYRLAVPADLPAGAFWSVGAYLIEADGRSFFYQNAAGRYAIKRPLGGRSPDAPQTVCFGPEKPEDPALSEAWLATPEGPFRVVFRLYRPQTERPAELDLPPIARAPC